MMTKKKVVAVVPEPDYDPDSPAVVFNRSARYVTEAEDARRAWMFAVQAGRDEDASRELTRHIGVMFALKELADNLAMEVHKLKKGGV